jgi:putative NADPH-quinone reductase
MRVLIILDHPWEKSFNHSILETFIEGLQDNHHEIDLLDLNKEGFDPRMTADELALYGEGKFLDPKVGEYQQRIMQADHLVFIFPIWWQVMPATLKGFLDKVLLHNWAFVDAKPQPIGKLTHIQGATVITTSGVSNGYYNFVYHNALKSTFLKGTLRFCGIQNVRWVNYGKVGEVDHATRCKWLQEIKSLACRLTDIPPVLHD